MPFAPRTREHARVKRGRGDSSSDIEEQKPKIAKPEQSTEEAPAESVPEVNASEVPSASASAPAGRPMGRPMRHISEGTAGNFLFRDMGHALANIRIPKADVQPYDEGVGATLERDVGKGLRGAEF